MLWFKRVLGAVVVLALLLVAGGLLAPSRYHVERTMVIHATPDRLYPLVADPHRWKDWSVWTQRDPAMRMEYFGAASGAGAGWSWNSASEGQGRMTFTRADPATGLDYELYFPDFGSTSTGVFHFEPAPGGGTLVRWTNDGDTGRNPLMHYMALAMDRLVGPDFEAGLARLKDLAEKP